MGTGSRDEGEDPETCCRRELREELGWEPPIDEPLTRVCDLYVDGKLIAWFFEAEAPPPETRLQFEPGRKAIWARYDDLKMSPWHLCVLEARDRGETRYAPS